MLAIYETVNRRLTRADEIEEGTWICLTAPSQEEIREVAATLDIEPADVQAALDPEESARISLEDGYTVIIVDIPLKVDGAAEGVYTTIPLGILLTQTTITTVCSVDTPYCLISLPAGCAAFLLKRRCALCTRFCTAPPRCTSRSCA